MVELTRKEPDNGIAYRLHDLQVDVKMFELGTRLRSHAPRPSAFRSTTSTPRPVLNAAMHEAFTVLNSGRRDPEFWISSKNKDIDIDSLRRYLPTTPRDDEDAITLLPGWTYSCMNTGFVQNMSIPIPRRLFGKEDMRQFGIITEVRLGRGLLGVGGEGVLVASKVFAASHFTDSVLSEMKNKW